VCDKRWEERAYENMEESLDRILFERRYLDQRIQQVVSRTIQTGQQAWDIMYLDEESGQKAKSIKA
jgi:hypothetical protein